jgi:hypothetical protein
LITHCDGALRFFNQDDFKIRLKYHIKHSNARRIGKRIKIFQIDEPIEQSLFMNLATTFLVWNKDALEYFN